MGDLIKVNFRTRKRKRREARQLLQDYIQFKRDVHDVRSPFRKTAIEVVVFVVVLGALLAVMAGF